MQYNNLHEYLDEVFEGQDPTKLEIKQAKQDYWRDYNTQLKRRSRKNKRTFSVWFTRKEIVGIESLKKKGVAVSSLIRRLVTNELQTTDGVIQEIDTAVIEQQLFLIAEYLQEVLDADLVLDTTKIESLELKVKELQNIIQQDFDY